VCSYPFTTQEDEVTETQTPLVPTPTKQSNVLSIVSFVLSALAVVILPIVFGVLAIICGGVAVSRKERLGKTALAVSIVATILGFALGYLVFTNS
jgi:Na+/H+-dicarboxylate symporter